METSSARPQPRSQTSRQDTVNRRVYFSAGVYRYYLSQQLTPPESACLSKYHRHIADHDVLDIGVGAGRTARHLAPLARRYEAVDYSPVMVSYVKKVMPAISIRQADFRDLGTFEDRSFDFLFATDNVIDALCHQDRLQALSEAARVLVPGGLLAFSSHNIRYKNAFSAPRLTWSSNPVRLAINAAKYFVSRWNHFHVAPLRQITPEYALVNDPGHHYACLHYYTSRSVVEAQMDGCGLRLIDAFDNRGEIAKEGEDDSESPHLLYVAERR